MRYWRDEIWKLCEEIEEEEETGDPAYHRGRRYTAKQIRRYAGQLAEELSEENPIFKYGH